MKSEDSMKNIPGICWKWKTTLEQHFKGPMRLCMIVKGGRREKKGQTADKPQPSSNKSVNNTPKYMLKHPHFVKDAYCAKRVVIIVFRMCSFRQQPHPRGRRAKGRSKHGSAKSRGAPTAKESIEGGKAPSAGDNARGWSRGSNCKSKCSSKIKHLHTRYRLVGQTKWVYMCSWRKTVSCF